MVLTYSKILSYILLIQNILLYHVSFIIKCIIICNFDRVIFLLHRNIPNKTKYCVFKMWFYQKSIQYSKVVFRRTRKNEVKLC